MPKKSATNSLVRRSAKSRLPTPSSHLAKLRAAIDGPIDITDIPERTGPVGRVKRDASGRIPRPSPPLEQSPIRRTILVALGRKEMTRYELWKAARVHCPTLPQSAVYEYLRGTRAIQLPYAEALMAAAGLVVRPVSTRRARPKSSTKPQIKGHDRTKKPITI